MAHIVILGPYGTHSFQPFLEALHSVARIEGSVPLGSQRPSLTAAMFLGAVFFVI